LNLYAESSAVLAWLLGERHGNRVREILAGAFLILASDLTLIECERVLIRASGLGGISEATLAGRRAILNATAAHWNILRLGGDIVDRARRPFPCEPIRTLDAIHLACALSARAIIPDLRLLSLDQRIRASGKALGLDPLPELD
jgi:predicted nucleic acid-binding protein